MVAGMKRKSVDDTEVVAKRARSDSQPLLTAYRSKSELENMSKEDLVQHSLDLQEQLAIVHASVPEIQKLSAEEVTKRTAKVTKLLIRGIEKQMKWSSSCATGKARFAYDGHVQDELIFKTMFHLVASHVRRMFKIPVYDFEQDVGRPKGKVRYSTLNLTGTDVNIRWSPEEKTFKVSGTYGR